MFILLKPMWKNDRKMYLNNNDNSFSDVYIKMLENDKPSMTEKDAKKLADILWIRDDETDDEFYKDIYDITNERKLAIDEYDKDTFNMSKSEFVDKVIDMYPYEELFKYIF